VLANKVQDLDGWWRAIDPKPCVRATRVIRQRCGDKVERYRIENVVALNVAVDLPRAQREHLPRPCDHAQQTGK